MRRGVLMRKILYSGAWNTDVWLRLFPMSLADRSFDSDGNCVCVSDRVRALYATMFNVKFQFFSVYFPTSWECDETVEQVYDLLTVFMSACMREGATPLVAGDFNASMGRALPHDEVEFLGSCGCGHRNARGWSLVDWVLGNGLVIQNRMDTTMNNNASRTCHRSFDGALVQLDFVVSSSRMTLVRSWCDYCISIGLDHRCVHCIVTFVSFVEVQL